MSLKDDKDLLISLYEESLYDLKGDLKLVKTDTTRTLIADEIKLCEKQLVIFRNL